ncbi:FHA domain-containing protein [Paludisphaera mucosa]|uniref:FHA domain-containing protein n=1 Tax=Paludisphaera mucosa TaxID=3030827 RepID=A0ABT6FDI7_9BACT|nr:FHA domain-containing protein [Paludisphaera mucosa]MDG3005561.1 FHA domain-containing protein [Paludisphaera mucosa]
MTTAATDPHVMARAIQPGRFRASVRQAYDLALAGALGGLFGLYLYVETVEARSVYVRDAWAGAIIGGSIGFFLNAWGPLRDGSWRRMARAAAWATPASALGGAIGLVLGEFVIGAFQGGLIGRAASWAVLGLGIGLGQGIADRSFQRLTFGLIGGGLGGFVGGLCFEVLRIVLKNRYDLSQALGIVILGGGLGLFLALVEQALRRAWVQVASGRQEGRIYLLARPVCRLGLDERADVGVFGDPAVERAHAEIVRSGDGYVLRNLSRSGATRVNGVASPGERRLGDGDRIQLGQTSLIFRRR